MIEYAPAWGSPEAAAVKPPAIPKVGRIILMVIGFLVAAIVAATILVGPAENDSPGGSFYAAPGWTLWKVSELSHSLKRDGGLSEAMADCVTKTIVGGTTWLEWESLGASSQVAEIKGAARSC